MKIKQEDYVKSLFETLVSILRKVEQDEAGWNLQTV